MTQQTKTDVEAIKAELEQSAQAARAKIAAAGSRALKSLEDLAETVRKSKARD